MKTEHPKITDEQLAALYAYSHKGRGWKDGVSLLRQCPDLMQQKCCLISKNTTLLLNFTHELEAAEEMARATGRDFSARQRLASEGVFERQAVISSHARHRRAWEGAGSRDQTTAWFGEVKEKMMFDYPVTLTPDDGTVLVTFADVPEAITFGADEDEALLNGIDALETGLSFYVDARKPLPVPSQPAAGQKTVHPSALECAKLGVYQAMTDQGIKKAELARRLGWHMPQVDRLFDLRHASKLDQIEAAANVLGKQLLVQIA